MSDALVSETTLNEISERGLALYETHLKSILEPTHNGQYVAIHVDTGEYAIGRWAGAAARLLHQQHAADRRILVRKIGPEPDYSLSHRILYPDLFGGSPQQQLEGKI